MRVCVRVSVCACVRACVCPPVSRLCCLCVKLNVNISRSGLRPRLVTSLPCSQRRTVNGGLCSVNTKHRDKRIQLTQQINTLNYRGVLDRPALLVVECCVTSQVKALEITSVYFTTTFMCVVGVLRTYACNCLSW